MCRVITKLVHQTTYMPCWTATDYKSLWQPSAARGSLQEQHRTHNGFASRMQAIRVYAAWQVARSETHRMIARRLRAVDQDRHFVLQHVVRRKTHLPLPWAIRSVSSSPD